MQERGYEYFPLMAPIGYGTDALVKRCAALLSQLPPIRRFEPEPVVLPAAETLDRHAVQITRHDGYFEVTAPWLLQIMRGIHFDDEEGLQYFERVLRATGVIDALEAAGVQEGDTVSIYDLDFDFVN